MPALLRDLFGLRRRELLIEPAISEKILRDHPLDHPYLSQLELLLDRWQYAGLSPKHEARIEIYGQIEEIWFTVVVRQDPVRECSILLTMHRLYRRKVESRLRKGYLVVRED